MWGERMRHDYVHGYSQREHERLVDQAGTLTELLHGDTRYPAGSSVLEAGCGVGAQTVTLARNSPGARFTCLDVSSRSLEAARARARAASLENVTFQQARHLRAALRPEASFDHVFVCFVLEHLRRPVEALAILRPASSRVARSRSSRATTARPSSTPTTWTRDAAIDCLVDAPGARRRRRAHRPAALPAARAGGAAGRRASRRGWSTWTRAAPSGSRASRGTPSRRWSRGCATRRWRRASSIRSGCARGVAGLRRTAAPDGVFCYTFFKAVGVR